MAANPHCETCGRSDYRVCEKCECHYVSGTLTPLCFDCYYDEHPELVTP